MDTGEGTFRLLDDDDLKRLGFKAAKPPRVVPSETKIAQRIFSVGEEIRIKGSRFRVEEIQESGRMVLQVLEQR